MPDLATIRRGKPASYPDQAVHAEYAARQLGLTFTDMDNGTGLLFAVASAERRAMFGAGRCSFFPQNDATAYTLANDKQFSAAILAEASVPALQGQYFFLHERYSAHRPAGHERSDAAKYFEQLGRAAFAKPLNGSRGDYAQRLTSQAALSTYLDDVSRYYDAIIMQPIASGDEYRIFIMDDEVVYCARKYDPAIYGDGERSITELLQAHNLQLQAQGLSDAVLASCDVTSIPPAHAPIPLDGRRNRSAGGSMQMEAPANEASAFLVARRAARALNLRVAGVDIFTSFNGDPEACAVIEVNANPSIRFLEQAGRKDLILRIWRNTFTHAGLIGV